MPNKNNNTLIILMLVSGLLYILKSFNDDEVAKGRSKWYLLRRSIVGAVGSALFVWWSFELLKFYEMPESLCLATAGTMGYLGADVLARVVEKFIDKFANKL